MKCLSRASRNQVELPSEINIHLPAHLGRGSAGAFAFPRLSICLDCGLTSFTLPRTELEPIREASSQEDAA